MLIVFISEVCVIREVVIDNQKQKNYSHKDWTDNELIYNIKQKCRCIHVYLGIYIQFYNVLSICYYCII